MQSLGATKRMVKYIGVATMLLYAVLVHLGATSLAQTENSALITSDQIIFHFHGEDSLSHAGSTLTCLGDVNGDGFGDIAASSREPAGTYIFFGGDPPDSFPDMFIRGTYGALPPIDLDGDGIDDLVVNQLVSFDGHGHGRVYFYKGYGDSLGSEPYDSIPGDSVNYGFLCHAVGHVDADSLGDLLVWQWHSGGMGEMKLYLGCPTVDKDADWSYLRQDYEQAFAQSCLIDYNGDGFDDAAIALPPRNEGLGYVYIYFGPSFASEPDMILGYPIEIVDEVPGINLSYFVSRGISNLGDVNHDGWPDLWVPFSTHGLIYRGGPQSDTVYDYELDYLTGKVVNGGDVNGDGADDLLSFGYQLSSYHNVDVYLGGLEFDTRPDYHVMRSDLPPLFIDWIGYSLCSAGDFDGDGIDDFAFATENFAYGDHGEVFVFKGSTDIKTGLRERNQGLVPEDRPTLTNYPNPFNQTTTIELDLSRPARVSITVYNITGREVKRIIHDKRLPAGRHTVDWNAVNSRGQALASGTYIVAAKSNGWNCNRRVTLIK